MFTRQHYKAIAQIINSQRNTDMVSKDEAFGRLANQLADYFEGDNPRFDRDKFIYACGKWGATNGKS